MRYITAIVLIIAISCSAVSDLSGDLTSNTFKNSLARNSGVDLSITEISVAYPDPIDRQKYQMLSSNYPIQNFDRPANLFVVDAVKNVPIQVTAKVENLGAADSKNVNAKLIIKHDEYENFELHNISLSIGDIASGSFANASFNFTPNYSGNHTLTVTPSSSIPDDNLNNDVYFGTFTVASYYFNCDHFTGWSVGPSWQTSAEEYLSESSSCHYGNGKSSNYQPNVVSDFISPVFDFSDAIENPNRVNGISFFYTGSLATGDFIRIYGNTPTNTWTELHVIEGNVDDMNNDPITWTMPINNYAGTTSIVIPVDYENFHSNSRFKFTFTSDSNNNDIGFWMDELVIFYDQKISPVEYDVTSFGNFVNGAIAETWGKARFTVANTGNVSELFRPSVLNLPNDWDYYFSYNTGLGISENSGFTLQPSEQRLIDFNYKPNSTAETGLYPSMISIQSDTYTSVIAQLNIQLEVLPDRIPLFLPQLNEAKCQPGSTCLITVELTNSGGAADVFILSINSNNLPVGWNVAFSWNQPVRVLVQPDSLVQIDLTYTVPANAVPDSTATFELLAESENYTTRKAESNILLSAAMESNAEVIVQSGGLDQEWKIEPGENFTLYFEVHNHAIVQDIFETDTILTNSTGWTVGAIIPDKLLINSGKYATFSVTITAPNDALSSDSSPQIIGRVTSQKSGEKFQSNSIDNIDIVQINDISVVLSNSPREVIPGAENLFEIELENKGNGGVEANLSISGLDESWKWYMYDIDGNLTGNIELPIINKKYQAVISVLVPAGINPNTEVIFAINIAPNNSSEDINRQDNQINITTMTGMVRSLGFTGNDTQISIGLGNLESNIIYVVNQGNVKEESVLIQCKIMTSNYQKSINATFTIGAAAVLYDFNTFHTISLDKGEQRKLRVDFIVPDDMSLGSTIEVIFEIKLSGADNITINKTSNYVADYVRKFSSTINGTNLQPSLANDIGGLWVNLTTKSTFSETIELKFITPNDWDLRCQLNPYRNGNILINQPYKGEIIRTSITYCEVFNLGNNYTGIVEVLILDENKTLLDTNTIKLYFTESEGENPGFSVDKVGGIIATGLLMSIILVKFLQTKKRTQQQTHVQNNLQTSPIINQQMMNSNTHSALHNTNQYQYTQPVTSYHNHQSNQPIYPNTPPIPQNGLPPGWTLEQWHHYGNEYLERNRRG